jgi:hypothetical protein
MIITLSIVIPGGGRSSSIPSAWSEHAIPNALAIASAGRSSSTRGSTGYRNRWGSTAPRCLYRPPRFLEDDELADAAFVARLEAAERDQDDAWMELGEPA